jgi:hypothetical protein
MFPPSFWEAYPVINRFSIAIVQRDVFSGKHENTSHFSGSRENGSLLFQKTVGCSRPGCKGVVDVDGILESAVSNREMQFTSTQACGWGGPPCTTGSTIAGTLEFVA